MHSLIVFSYWYLFLFTVLLLFGVFIFWFNLLKKKSILVNFVPQGNQSLTEIKSGTLRLLTYNVAGLPQGISAAKTNRKEAICEIGVKLNGFDIVNVQEDFNYNRFLYLKNVHPFRTINKGKIPIGDGLNTLSKFPILSYRRISWQNCSGADCCTIKGFSVSKIQLAPEICVDIYNVHANSSDTAYASRARRANLRQLSKYILEHSAGMPLIVMGDFNAHYAHKKDNLFEFIDQTELVDCWVKYCRRDCFPDIISNFKAQNMLSLTNETESLDKIFYRNSEHLKFRAVGYNVENDFFVDDKMRALSDHLAVAVNLEWTWVATENESNHKISKTEVNALVEDIL